MKPHTDLEPDLFVERSNFLGSGQNGCLLGLRLQRQMAVDLGMGSEVAMVGHDGCG